MLIDLINSNNYISINLNMIKIFGLVESVYCSELINIYQKATKKNKISEDGFFSIDRNYIAKRTTIPIKGQLDIDEAWREFGLIQVNENDKNNIKLDTELLTTIIAEEEEETITKLRCSLHMKLKKVKTDDEKAKAREGRLTALKNVLKDSGYDEDFLVAINKWIDAIVEKFSVAKFTNMKVKEFAKYVNDYSKDKRVQLEVINIATKYAYREAQWAINIYERKNLPTSKLRVTNQKVATESDIDTSKSF